MRRLLLVAMLVGCGIDESGLLETSDGAPNDVSVLDVGTKDVTVDVASNDAGVDVERQDDAQVDVVVVDAPPEATVDAGPILTITGGNYTILDLDSGLCSQTSNTAASLTVANDRDAAVDLVWVNFQCGEQGYGTINSGGQTNVNTYVTHVWRVRNDADKSLLAQFVLNSGGSFTATVH